eukprot:scaffold1517_cov105-Cylindrotheca_fusiformis.AAC.2
MVGTSLPWLLLNFLGGFINSAIRDPIPCRRGCFRRRFLCGFEKMDAACETLLWLQPVEAGEGVTKCVLSTEDEENHPLQAKTHAPNWSTACWQPDALIDEVDSMSFPNDFARDSEGSSTSCWLILDFPKIRVGHNQVDFRVSKILETTVRETLREVPG